MKEGLGEARGWWQVSRQPCLRPPSQAVGCWKIPLRLSGLSSGLICVLLLMSPEWSLPSLGSGFPWGPEAGVTDDMVFEVTVHEALCVAGMNPGCFHWLEEGVSL